MEKEPYWVKFADLGLIRLNQSADTGGGGDDDDDDDDDGDDEDDDDKSTRRRRTRSTRSEGDDDGDDDGDDGDDDEKLGPKGQRAIDRMKAKVKEANRRRIAAEKALAAKSGDADKEDKEKAQREAEEKVNKRIVRTEVKAAAKGKLADPKDALLFIDLDQFEVDDDGDVDEEEIADAIEELLAKKPHLAAQGGSRKPKPDTSQGARGSRKSTPADAFAAHMRKQLGG